MGHLSLPIVAWDALRGRRHPVLGHGFVALVDIMGDDAAVVEAARLTSQKEGATYEDDRGLIRYLMRKRHSTPFEFVTLKFHVKCPMDVWRQWIRHRTASVNEYSTRYSPAIDQMERAEPDQWRLQSKSNRQGSAGAVGDAWPEGWSFDDGTLRFFDNKNGSRCSFSPTEHDVSTPGAFLTYDQDKLQSEIRRVYDRRLSLGVALEQARKDLPLSTYTEAYWQINLHNLLHFLGLRLDGHAQQEIRAYADVMAEMVRSLLPVTWEAFMDFRLESVSLSRLDRVMLELIVLDGKLPVSVARFHELQLHEWRSLKRCSERDECLAKLIKLKLVDPDLP